MATTTFYTTYKSHADIRKGDRVQHPDGRKGTVMVDPGWAAYIKMDGEDKAELWQLPFVIVNFKLISRGAK